jgi:hypothetical protein
LKYWKNMSEVGMGATNKQRSAWDSLIGSFMKNATPVRLANPFVWLKQPMSMPAAVAYFGNAKYLANMYGPRDGQFIKDVLKANGTLAGRAAGKHFDPNLPEWRGEGSGSAITGVYRSRLSAMQGRSANFVQAAMGRSDKVAINGIIMAARQYVKDTQPNLKGDEFVAEVGRQAAMAVKMTQVATYGIDRTMMERNITNPFQRMMTYMWGARGAQFNLLAHSMKGAFVNGTPDAMRNAAMVWATAGIAQSAQIVLVDMMRSRGDDPPSEDDYNKAYSAGVQIFESMATTMPGPVSEFVSAMTAPIYRQIGDKKTAQLRNFRMGKTGPLSGTVTDVSKMFSVMSDMITGAKQMEGMSRKQRARFEELQAQRLKSGRKALIRVGSEMFGVPVSQVANLLPE